MEQLSIFDYTPPKSHFGGSTYDAKHDFKRLNGQLLAVFNTMKDGCWRTLGELSQSAHGSEAGCSARLRDLRKEDFGSHTVLKQPRGDRSRGSFEYRLIINPTAV